MQDSSLTAIDATMYLTGKNLWPFTDDKKAILVSALYDNIQVKPIDIRVTQDSLEPNNRRRSRHLLQVGFSYTPNLLAPPEYGQNTG